jgi:hypothetical protein
MSAHSHLTCSFTLPAIEPIWMQRRWADAPAALQGSSVLATATATAPFRNEWVGQVPDLQLGFLLPITTRAIPRRASAQALHRSGSSSRPNGRNLRGLVAGTAGVAEVDAMHPSAVHEDPYSMISRALTLRTQPHGKSNGLHCLDCEPTTPLVWPFPGTVSVRRAQGRLKLRITGIAAADRRGLSQRLRGRRGSFHSVCIVR